MRKGKDDEPEPFYSNAAHDPGDEDPLEETRRVLFHVVGELDTAQRDPRPRIVVIRALLGLSPPGDYTGPC